MQKLAVWRILLKGIVLFWIIVFLFPLFPDFGYLSVYNTFIIPGRKRFAFSTLGSPSTETYNVIINNLPALFNTHEIAGAFKKDDEFRIIVLGDSSVWGTLLTPDEVVTAYMNRSNVSFCGKKARFYNLGHPNPSIIKDLMIYDYALRYEPDYVIWFTTLEAFPLKKQITEIPLVISNPERVRDLIDRYDLPISLDDTLLVPKTYWQKNLIAQRRQLKDLISLQIYGIMWSATGIDQAYPPYEPPPVEYSEDLIEFQDMMPPLNQNELSYNVIEIAMNSSEIPILLVNEPMMISPNSQVRYNLRYPRWAYDPWRIHIKELAEKNQWSYLDLWDQIPSPEYYTNSAFHRIPVGEAILASKVVSSIQVDCR